MFERNHTYYYLPSKFNAKEDESKLKLRITTYYPYVEFISEYDTDMYYNSFPMGLINNPTVPECSIVLDSIEQIDKSPDKFIYFYMELYKKGIKLFFYRAPFLDTISILNLCYIFKDSDDVEDEDVRKVLSVQLGIYLKNKDDYRREKNAVVTEARKIRQLTGTQEENELRKEKATKFILDNSNDFNGNMTDVEVMKHLDIGRNTYYRYKKELKNSNKYF